MFIPPSEVRGMERSGIGKAAKTSNSPVRTHPGVGSFFALDGENFLGS